MGFIYFFYFLTLQPWEKCGFCPALGVFNLFNCSDMAEHSSRSARGLFFNVNTRKLLWGLFSLLCVKYISVTYMT